MPRPLPTREEYIERFWSRVDRTETCWFWVGGKTYGGYGVFRISGKTVLTHRFSFELSKGHIPTNMDVHHSCENPSCVNPEHLSAMEHSDNVQIGMNKWMTAWKGV